MLTKSLRYATMFEALEQRSEIAWIPFIMLGYSVLMLAFFTREEIIQEL